VSYQVGAAVTKEVTATLGVATTRYGNALVATSTLDATR
jgi:hypothetical protein